MWYYSSGSGNSRRSCSGSGSSRPSISGSSSISGSGNSSSGSGNSIVEVVDSHSSSSRNGGNNSYGSSNTDWRCNTQVGGLLCWQRVRCMLKPKSEVRIEWVAVQGARECHPKKEARSSGPTQPQFLSKSVHSTNISWEINGRPAAVLLTQASSDPSNLRISLLRNVYRGV